MSHHPAVTHLGFTGRNAVAAASFVRAMGLQGVPETKAVKVLESYAKIFGPNARVSIENVGPWLEYAAGRNGWGNEIVDACANWFTQVDKAGGNPEVVREFAYQPTSHLSEAARQARINEIRAICRNDPDAYEALRDEHMALLEGAADAGSAPSTRPAQSAGNSSASARLAEIRQYRRDDPDAYEADKNLQREELALLSQTNPSPVPSPAGGDGGGAAPDRSGSDTAAPPSQQLSIEDRT